MKLLGWALRKSAIPHAEIPMEDGAIRRVPIISFKELDPHGDRRSQWLRFLLVDQTPGKIIKPALHTDAEEVLEKPLYQLYRLRFITFIRALRHESRRGS